MHGQLEGAISSGEKRLQAQAQELEACKVWLQGRPKMLHCHWSPSLVCRSAYAQGDTLSSLQACCAKLIAERDNLAQQVGVTPERCRTERAALHAKARKCAWLHLHAACKNMNTQC